MDRIREAINRARDHKDALIPKHETAAQPVAVKSTQTSPHGGPQITPVSCDFDGFSEHRIISNEQDPVLNAYRVLRTRVLQKMEKEGWKTLAVASPGAGAGKTVTAINLAIAIGSKAGMRPTLVDLDFYRPSVARYLGLKDFPSVLDYFEGDKSLEEVTLRPDLPDMLLIANERVTRRGAEHLTSDRMDQLIKGAVEDFESRIIIFDMSPILGCDDTISFLPKVDCVLLIASSGQTRVEELKEARRLLDKTNIIGTVLNKAPSLLVANPYY